MSEQDGPLFGGLLITGTVTATATHPDGAEVPPPAEPAEPEGS